MPEPNGTPEETLIEFGLDLMQRRGMTYEEFSVIALLMLATVGKALTQEADKLVKTALAKLESEGKTKQ